ncbi:MAG: hypothetical protein NTW95_06545 [Candidatus Aminicenantes bacterium]|nr:hypothetical protein [Candidatus Aminicenantes bacterium]
MGASLLPGCHACQNKRSGNLSGLKRLDFSNLDFFSFRFHYDKRRDQHNVFNRNCPQTPTGLSWRCYKNRGDIISWDLIEADGTFYWKTPMVFFVMMFTLAILLILTFIWLKNIRRKGMKYLLIFLVPIYIVSPWIQILLVNLYVLVYVFVYEIIYPNTHMDLHYSIAWASPIDKAITFGAPPLIALIVGLRSWIVSKKLQKTRF